LQLRRWKPPCDDPKDRGMLMVGERSGQEARVQIQYLGFQPKPRGRDYLYLVIDAKAGKREFTFTISNQAFAERRVPYQDAADLC
jgi:hypothetical protein